MIVTSFQLPNPEIVFLVGDLKIDLGENNLLEMLLLMEDGELLLMKILKNVFIFVII